MFRALRFAISFVLVLVTLLPFATLSAKENENEKKPVILNSSTATTTLTINGSNLAPGKAKVLLGAFGPLTVVSQSSTQIVVVLPPALLPGDYVLNLQIGENVDESSVTVGAVGPQGPAGPAGVAGATGPQGQIGITGAVGLEGKKGDKGDTGPQGLIGPAGAMGAAGPQGPQGTPGTKGDTGATGPQGTPGTKGDTGATGPQGLPGPKGDTGPQGSVGSNSGGELVSAKSPNSVIFDELAYKTISTLTLSPATTGNYLIFVKTSLEITPDSPSYTRVFCQLTAQRGDVVGSPIILLDYEQLVLTFADQLGGVALPQTLALQGTLPVTAGSRWNTAYSCRADANRAQSNPSRMSALLVSSAVAP